MRVNVFLILAGLALLTAGCQSQVSPPVGKNVDQRPAMVLARAPAAVQAALLNLAMESASAIPVVPHIKDRSLAQEKVVEACLQLDFYAQARTFTADVKDWRSGACYADLAYYQARHGKSEELSSLLSKADLIANAVGLEEWRRDAIRVKLAQTHVMLRNDTEARLIESRLPVADNGKVAGVRAMQGDDGSFEQQFKALSAMVGSKDFDVSTSGSQSLVQVYDRFYEDAGRRLQVEEMIRSGWAKYPIALKIEIVLKLSDAALAHKDAARAMTLVVEAEKLKESASWYIEIETPLAARLAQYRYQAGDQGQAEAALAKALAKYEKDKELMLNVERVGALLPVAEAYLAISDRAGAMSVYKHAAEEGVVNPNSRPRAMDLSALCISLAVHGMEPDAELWARLRKIRQELGDPW